MINNKNRNGNFTSSEIFNLLSVAKDGKNFGKPALEYISEKRFERNLGRSLNVEVSARPTSWGKLVETKAFELIGLEYTLCSTETIVHPYIDYWCGSPDGVKKYTVMDIKCPLTLKSFCQRVQPIYEGITGIEAMNLIRKNHKSGEQDYWQLVSNAILTKSKFGELIIFVPYKSELDSIREMAANFDGNQNKFAWINWAEDNELPFLNDEGFYKNINIINFEIPQSDIELLTEKVIQAGKLLIQK